MKIQSHSPEETRQFAAEFTQTLPEGSVLGLIGDLGAGKTAFIQGMAEGLGIDPEGYVTSPTFALIHEYNDKLFHFDLYRLNSFNELIDIGFEDYTQRNGICVLEWANRFPELAPQLSHRIEIAILGEEAREIVIS